MGGVAFGLASDDRADGLVETLQVTRFDEALGRFTFTTFGVFVIPRVPKFNTSLDADRGARISTVRVLVTIRQNCGLQVVPMDEIAGDCVAPVDEFLRELGGVLEEGVVGVAVDNEAVWIIEAPDRRDDVEDRVVGVFAGTRVTFGSAGERKEILSHVWSIAALSFV